MRSMVEGYPDRGNAPPQAATSIPHACGMPPPLAGGFSQALATRIGAAQARLGDKPRFPRQTGNFDYRK